MKKLFILLLVVLVGTLAFGQNVKRHYNGVGVINPGKMTKGAAYKQIIWKAPLSAAYKRLIPSKADHTLRFCIGQFPRGGMVADFYLIMGTYGLGDSIAWADTALAKHYQFYILKSNGDTLGTRRTRLAADLGLGTSKPRPDSLWFITGTDTTSKAWISGVQRLYCSVDTGGGVPDSLPTNWWVIYKYFPNDND
jgi:hypothetical protein